MNTTVFTAETLEQAATLLRRGELVAFPTETVYGLGAVATLEQAVSQVYQAKGRPSDNPLIVHVSTVQQVLDAVVEFPPVAEQLAAAFWPGPLTMILEQKPHYFAPSVTKLATVAFRMPNHPLALELIQEVGIPIVGPSANKSGRPSPTRVAHVLEDMNGRIAGVVDGGICTIGVESTVIDLTNPIGPVILRPGAITAEQLERVIGPLATNTTHNEQEAPKAPGMKYRHYAPETRVVVFRGLIEDVQQEVEHYKQQGLRVGILATNRYQQLSEHFYSLGEYGDVQSMTRQLFDGLRTLDQEPIDLILAEGLPEEGNSLAYMNRLNKAAVK